MISGGGPVDFDGSAGTAIVVPQAIVMGTGYVNTWIYARLDSSGTYSGSRTGERSPLMTCSGGMMERTSISI